MKPVTIPKAVSNVDVRELKGLLKRPRRRAVTVKEMNRAILRQHSKKQ